MAALHARETDRIDDGGTGRADVLVCRWDEDSLHRLAALARTTPGPRPLLALTAAAPAALDDLHGRLPGLRSRFGPAVLLPHVPGWRERPVLAEAAAVLAEPAEHLPAPLRAYAVALRRLVAVLRDSGVLHRMPPALVIAPRPAALWRGLRPVERVLGPDPLGGGTPGADLAGAAGRAG